MAQRRRMSKFKAKKLFNKGYRKCVICKKIKSLDLFYKNRTRKGGYAYDCKMCKNESHRKYREKDYVKIAEAKRAKKYRKKNKKRLLNQRYLKDYGITTNGKKIRLKQQNYCCKICKNKIDMISGHIDHSHKIGKIRGLLCKKCNTAIGLFKDNLNILKEAVKYLKHSNQKIKREKNENKTGKKRRGESKAGAVRKAVYQRKSKETR